MADKRNDRTAGNALFWRGCRKIQFLEYAARLVQMRRVNQFKTVAGSPRYKSDPQLIAHAVFVLVSPELSTPCFPPDHFLLHPLLHPGQLPKLQ